MKMIKKIDWNIGVIFLLPLFLLFFSRAWLFTPAGSLDPWYYVGYFLQYPDHLPFFDGDYKISRLPWILKGYLAYKFFPPLAANYILHIGVFSIALLAFYLNVRCIFDRKVAIITSIVFGYYTHAHGSGGWDYHSVDALANYLLSLMCISFAAKGKHWKLWLFIAGGTFFSAVHDFIILLNYLPLAVLWYFFFNRKYAKNSLKTSLFLFILGGFLVTAFYGMVNYLTGGRFLFFLPQIFAAIWLSFGNQWFTPFHEFAVSATWLVSPAIILAASLVLCIKYFTNRKKSPVSEEAVFPLIYFICTVAVHIFWHLQGQNTLEPDYMAVYMVPAMFFALAGIYCYLFENREVAYGFFLPVFTISIFLIPLVFVSRSSVLGLTNSLGNMLHINLTPVIISLALGFIAVALMIFQSKKSTTIFIVTMILSISNIFSGSSIANANGYYYGNSCSFSQNAYLAIIDSNIILKKIDPALEMYFWYENNEMLNSGEICGEINMSYVFDSLAATHLWPSRVIQIKVIKGFESFSNLEKSDILKIPRNTKIALLSAYPEKYETLLNKIESSGLSVKRSFNIPINRGVVSYILQGIEIADSANEK
jgi:hypothetical protein